MKKKIALGFALVFIACSVLEVLEHILLFTPEHWGAGGLFRPRGEVILWIFPATYLVFAFFFTLIFSKWYGGGGVREGARFGLYVSLMMTLIYHLTQYAGMPIPLGMAVQRVVLGTLENVFFAVILALVFGKKRPAA